MNEPMPKAVGSLATSLIERSRTSATTGSKPAVPTQRNAIGPLLGGSGAGERLKALAAMPRAELDAAVRALLPQRLKWRPVASGETLTGYEVEGTEADFQQAKATLWGLMDPLPPKALAVELTRLDSLVKRREGCEEIKIAAYEERLNQYPADAVLWTLREWPNRSPWFPAWFELREMLEDRIWARKAMLTAKLIEPKPDPRDGARAFEAEVTNLLAANPGMLRADAVRRLKAQPSQPEGG